MEKSMHNEATRKWVFCTHFGSTHTKIDMKMGILKSLAIEFKIFASKEIYLEINFPSNFEMFSCVFYVTLPEACQV